MTSARHGRAMAFIFVTVLIDSIGFGIVMPVLPQLIVELSGGTMSTAAIYGGWLAVVYALTQFFCAPIMGSLSDRFGRRPVLLLALLAFSADYALMGFAPTLAWLFVGRFIAGITGATFTPAYAFVADVSAPGAPVYFPGAAYFAAGLLDVVAALLLLRIIRLKAAAKPG